MIRLARVLFLLAVVGLGALGVSRLDYNVDILGLLPPELPGLSGTRLLRDQQVDSLILAVEGEDPDAVSGAVESLTNHLAGRPDLAGSVRSGPDLGDGAGVLADATAYAWWNAAPEKVRSLQAALAPQALPGKLQESLETLSLSLDGESVGLAAYDPLGLSAGAIELLAPATRDRMRIESDYVSRDGLLRLIYLHAPERLPEDYRAAIEWVGRVRDEVLDTWLAGQPEFAGIRVRFTGEIAFRAEVSRGMEADMQQSVGAVSVLVAVLFWLMHRSLVPMFWLLAAIFCANLLSLGTAVAIYGTLNVMSIGFAAILTGLIEDFGVVGLHESMESPGASYPEVLRRVVPGVTWSACTTAGIFATLSLSRLPGLAQLGVLCALGVLIGAAVMLFGFLPVAMQSKLKAPSGRIRQVGRNIRRWTGPAAAAAVALSVAAIAVNGFPVVELGSQVLRPKASEAYDAFDRIQEKMGLPPEEGTMVPVVLESDTAEGLRATARQAVDRLELGVASGALTSFHLPAGLIPDAGAQRENAPVLTALAARLPELERAIDGAGFTEEAAELTRRVAGRWREWAEAGGGVIWPPESVVSGAAGRLIGREGDRVTALGYAIVPPGENPSHAAVLRDLSEVDGVHPGGWQYMQGAIELLLHDELRRVGLPAAIVVLVLLPLVFRGLREIVFAAGTLAFGAFILTGVMSLTGLSWNMVSAGAIPLALGLGLDFTIHMIYALRRNPGDVDAVAGMGRALAYCGLSTGLAFGALATGTNQGLISLGLCTMSGVLIVLFSAAFVLPWAWHRFPGRGGPRQPDTGEPTVPSAIS